MVYVICYKAGDPRYEVRRLQDDQLRWEAAADEVRAFSAAQAYTIGAQLARDPAKSVLVPQVEEIKRLKAVQRRKKATPAAQEALCKVDSVVRWTRHRKAAM